MVAVDHYFTKVNQAHNLHLYLVYICNYKCKIPSKYLQN